MPVGGWPALLKPSLLSYAYVPPLPVAYWLPPGRLRGITFRILKIRPTEMPSLWRWTFWCSRTGTMRSSSFPCIRYDCRFLSTSLAVVRSRLLTLSLSDDCLYRDLSEDSLAFTLVVFPSPVAPVNRCPWTLPPLLHTSPLPATRLGLGTGLNTGRKQFYPLTLSKRLRVAHTVQTSPARRWWGAFYLTRSVPLPTQRPHHHL